MEGLCWRERRAGGVGATGRSGEGTDGGTPRPTGAYYIILYYVILYYIILYYIILYSLRGEGTGGGNAGVGHSHTAGTVASHKECL